MFLNTVCIKYCYFLTVFSAIWLHISIILHSTLHHHLCSKSGWLGTSSSCAVGWEAKLELQQQHTEINKIINQMKTGQLFHFHIFKLPWSCSWCWSIEYCGLRLSPTNIEHNNIHRPKLSNRRWLHRKLFIHHQTITASWNCILLVWAAGLFAIF